MTAINTAWHPLANGNSPTWASGWGQDSHGVWVEFTLVGEDKPVTQRMRWIQPGQFMMGSPEDEPGRWDDEGPQHRVTISQGFWLFDTPVVQALWLAVTGENPSKFQSADLVSFDRPVEQVSWNDCQDFLKEINRKLPGLDLTLPGEAQWEYACRAGSSTALYTGPIEIDDDTAPALDPIAWYSKNSGGETHPAAEKQANDWGLYDMLGNVWEWTADPWHENYQDAPEDGRVWQEEEAGKSDEPRRVVRGGSWGSRARYCRSASRFWFEPGDRFVDLGFRCVRVQV
ncbi:Formylglycine-generating enzyme, required for sulfatase activity, contains SUMF1/FGE domain [Candidatus Electrothrix marina]|uniref:Formylglycine-generating enzyme, required for sulfatase activity, contains SUMF1/FGE domain n=1 Tax=Candidatus Electrothrix marina TaxID=1859130 RepID=A0A444JEZ8_9BACT|nr:Formylglycine-generating enzyme, required for sulfatase activity, contains SUMF1/FGE domain [Candidatus Electrothrix marina]